jgi:hypothetical protein
MDVNNELRSGGLNYDFFDPYNLIAVPCRFCHARRRRAAFRQKRREKEKKKRRESQKVKNY